MTIKKNKYNLAFNKARGDSDKQKKEEEETIKIRWHISHNGKHYSHGVAHTNQDVIV